MANRTEVFIDGSNLFATLKLLDVKINYAKLHQVLYGMFEGVVRINYFTALLEDGDTHVPLRPLVDWLSYNEYNVVSKLAKRHIRSDGTFTVKGNMDVEITIGMVEASNYVNQVVLFSGDGDFISVIDYLQKKGVVVTVISSIETHPSVCSDELRKKTDKFVELNKIVARFLKEG